MWAWHSAAFRSRFWRAAVSVSRPRLVWRSLSVLAIGAALCGSVLAVDPTLGNPYFNLANVVTRSWTDEIGNYTPDCNLLNAGAQDLR